MHRGILFNMLHQLPHCFSCRCCEKNPEKRASSDELLKHPFLQQRNMASKEWLADYVKQTKETPTLRQWWQHYTWQDPGQINGCQAIELWLWGFWPMDVTRQTQMAAMLELAKVLESLPNEYWNWRFRRAHFLYINKP